MPDTQSKPLIVGISSRALFDLSESHDVFESQGVEAYSHYQIERENDILPKGAAYPIVKKLLALQAPDTGRPLVDVILLSRNSADTGLRIFNSIAHYGLNITRAAFTKGHSTSPYVNAFASDLFLSTNEFDVVNALNHGCAAARIIPSQTEIHQSEDDCLLRIAFDGDAVLFSDDSEIIYQTSGLDAFKENEARMANEPLPAGPFKSFLEKLHSIQKLFPADTSPIRTALVTARDAPCHERVVRTLRSWNIRIDEAFFMGGLTKRDILKAFNADLFFDDTQNHCHEVSENIAAGHVPHGVNNPKSDIAE